MRANEFILRESDSTYQPPSIEVGDEVRVGKFKNRKAEVKGFKTDKNNQPVLKTTKGDQQLFKPRITKLLSTNESLNSIDQENEGGSLEGYVVDTNQVQLKNYLSSQHADQNIADQLAKKFNRIGIIKNMYINDDSRGQGLGKDLFDNAIDAAYNDGAEAILLVADIQEQNKFNLVDWYKNYGFEIIGSAGGDPIMLLDEQ